MGPGYQAEPPVAKARFEPLPPSPDPKHSFSLESDFLCCNKAKVRDLHQRTKASDYSPAADTLNKVNKIYDLLF